MPPTKRKCRECVAAGLPDCKHCICPGCNWCLCRQEAGRGHRPDPARDAPALTTLALLAQNGKGAASVESAPCGALRESSGSVRCRSCRRHNVKKRKADAAIAARLAGSEAPVNPSPTARHIVGQRLKGANGGRAPLPDLVRETAALVGSERWSFAVAEAARRQSRAAPPLSLPADGSPGSRGAAAVVSPPTSLPVAWQKAGLTERPRDTHSAPRPEEDVSSRTLTEADDTALQTIELRSYNGGVTGAPPVLPSVSSEDLGQAERTV